MEEEEQIFIQNIRNKLTKRKKDHFKNYFKLQQKFLEEVTYSDVDFFSFNGYKTLSKCVKVYDGDTGTFVFFYHKKPYKFKIRLAEIDTAELKSKNEKEVEYAKKAKDRLLELIDNKLVYIECLEFDKYGRILVKIYRDKRCIKSFNQILLDEGLAYPYNGSKRIDFDEWISKNEDKDENKKVSEIVSKIMKKDGKLKKWWDKIRGKKND